MKKNTLAAALVAGLGLTGVAAAYTYGTDPVIATPEPVAYQALTGPAYNYTMNEALVFDIDIGDNIIGITTGFTVRVRVKDGALFNTTAMPVGGVNPSQATADGNPNVPDTQSELVLNPGILGWSVQLDGYDEGGAVAVIRIFPTQGAPVISQISPGRLLSWYDVKLTSLDELAAGTVTTVNGDFWMVNSTNDAMFVGSNKTAPILSRFSGVTACASQTGGEVDKYIDVADLWASAMIPKTRFSFDGKLGSSSDGSQFGNTVANQYIDLGTVTLTNSGSGFSFMATDTFTTVISGGAGSDWLAFDNDPTSSATLYNDDVWLTTGQCSSGLTGSFIRGEVQGSNVTFSYNATQAGVSVVPTATPVTRTLNVCAYANSDVVIDDHLNTVTTTFTRAGATETAPFGTNGSCSLLPLRYNGSTMEIFYINPGGNATQESFIRLTNRSNTAGWVRLEGIDDTGHKAAQQASILVPAGASVQVKASELQNGSPKVVGGWGAPTGGKWRAVVTAEFPGLVASSYVRNTGGEVLSNVTDSDTRGEQYIRDFAEGTQAATNGFRPSDVYQESTPDFHGDGQADGPLGGPNDGTTPTGGSTDPTVPGNGLPGYPPGNPGLDGTPSF